MLRHEHIKPFKSFAGRRQFDAFRILTKYRVEEGLIRRSTLRQKICSLPRQLGIRNLEKSPKTRGYSDVVRAAKIVALRVVQMCFVGR